MIGRLQTNKVKFALKIFDYIHSLDSIKLASTTKEQKKINKKLKIFIQINIGNENQKSGIGLENLNSFYEKCIKEFNLDIVGLMCLPPNVDENDKYFFEMKKLAAQIHVKELSGLYYLG